MMPLDLFGSRAFVGLSLYTSLLYGALGGPIVLLPFSMMIGVGSRIAGMITGRIGPRWPLTVGAYVTGSASP
jgi:hypothetical protein